MGNKKGISLLIPTYNRPHFLRRALISVLNQTRLPDEIIISDDNPHSTENFEAIKDLVEQYKGLIKYWKNNERLGVEKNYSKLLEEANYEYIKFLADDDLLHPEALELMEKVLNKYEDVVLVSSHRIPVNEEEEFIHGIEATKPLCKKDQILNGKEVIRKSLTDLKNYVGEFSTYMFRKSLLDINPFYFCNLHFRANADWVLWMYLLSKGNFFYYSRPLSFFTIHSQQDQANLKVQTLGFKERIKLILNEELHKTLKFF
ncbi:glycosyl transferase family 2 [Desulfurobacterium thermolithotrophum DSM 11699]|uniref:Glycosyl transferase family 2 n=1 Tax=Desulfurobacterium thermolithotrophum (strain DSM 11699 / BSA) TaxID=868864 RepID=F0S146_DESTD|nr:glycosyltransferase [Desulfurobacterium thermolithotrophum]ADY73924.1 glycosyl transferase family 2 [Desulfurobacterium thermolithotrophum DSM 11699]